jgi:hypothetical protein
MKTATTVTLALFRLCGLVALVLGLLFWTGNARSLLAVHMLVGIVLVLALWVLAGLAARAGVHPGFVALAVVWGIVVPALGIMQTRLLPGAAHWVIQVLHLLVGIVAMGLGQGLATRIERLRAPAGPPEHQVGATGKA